MLIIPTILCGGSGSRLWPVSRELHPKPFMKLRDGQSLLEKTFLRGASVPGVQEILTVTNRELFFRTQDIYRELNQTSLFTSYILEPFGKNTAAAVATAAHYIFKKYGEEAIMLVLAADHLIENQDSFQTAVDHAVELALANWLVTFGIRPSYPETGYGYIEVGANSFADVAHTHGFTVTRFVEKPSEEKAQSYLNSGNYLWNSGMFCFTAGTILKQMNVFCPEILSAISACMELSPLEQGQGYSHIKLDSTSFAKVPDNSFDYAVMEPASHARNDVDSPCLAVVPCDIGWSDIGSWHALGELSKPDEAGNCIEGEVLSYDTTNCYIQSSHHLVGTVGIDNLIIIDTPDALLVVDKRRAQDVKHLYAALKAKGHEAHKLHRTVHRPWGTYTILEEAPRFKIKRIEVNPGASLSLQMHHHRNEHWIVVSGMARVVNGESDVLVGPNESTYIPAGNKHRLENPGVVTLVLIEVQSGEYLAEDDIVRFQDNYGRA